MKKVMYNDKNIMKLNQPQPPNPPQTLTKQVTTETQHKHNKTNTTSPHILRYNKYRVYSYEKKQNTKKCDPHVNCNLPVCLFGVCFADNSNGKRFACRCLHTWRITK